MPTMHDASAAGAAADRASTRVHPKLRSSVVSWSIDVLLVDDDAADTSLILDVLKRNSDVGQTTSFFDPARALFALAEGQVKPDLIFLDVHMPKVNGFTFMHALRLIPGAVSTPVVYLTTSKHAKDVELARRSSAHGYIVKPDSYEELATRLNSVVKMTLLGDKKR